MSGKIHCKKDDATSPVISEILIAAIGVLIIVSLFAVVLGMIPDFDSTNQGPHEILKITDVSDIDKGIVTLKNIGKESIINKDHSAKVYVDGVEQLVIINTLSAHDFISTHHYGVKYVSGTGPSGVYWKPGEQGIFDLKDGIVRSGSVLRVEIIRNKDGKLISVSEYSVLR